MGVETFAAKRKLLPAMPQGFNASAAQAVRARVPVPVIAVGRIIDPAVAEKILSSGQADMVALGRQALADPDWPRKVKENRTEDLTKCLSCNDGCLGRAWKARAIFCVQNPALGNEAKYASLSRPRQPKKVIVAGGGPAGLEAARTAALRGHEVILYEKENTLGGQVTIAAVAPTKAELKEVITSRIKALAPLNVEIHLNEALNPSIVKTMAPEVLVVATGSEPLWPDIPGLERPGIITARDVLKGAQVGQRIIIIGGGLVGCETADFLSRQKKQVILIEMLPLLAREAAPASRYFLLGRLKNQKVQIHKATTVSRLTDNAVITSVNGEEKEALTADTVVLATGAKPVNALENALQGQVPQLYTIGDAVSPGNILQAVEQGALAAWKI